MNRSVLIIFYVFCLLKTGVAQRTAPELLKQAIICADAGELQSALELCNQSIAINPKYDLAFFQRATTREMMGDITGAIIDYSNVIQINSNNIQAYLNRGLLYHKIKRKWAAFKDFYAARSINMAYTISFLAGQAIKSLH
ncbi:MAG: tetratricopeptide repeat protein [Bacteroidetes bacterium]|nr:tetratricopeptide repeat protein [Bacteroidota bacterium]